MSADAKTPPDSAVPDPAAPPPQDPRGPAEARQERLARALRDNLKKRKAQQRRRQGAGGAGEEA